MFSQSRIVRRYLKVTRGPFIIDKNKVDADRRFDGKWVLQTNTSLTSSEVALKYKELWMVEHVFPDVKSILTTLPFFYKVDETIRGHVFCSFLALVLRKELDNRLEKLDMIYEWNDIKQDLTALIEIILTED